MNARGLEPIAALGALFLAGILAAGCDGGPGSELDGSVSPPLGDDPAAHCPPRDEVGCAMDIGGYLPRRVTGSTLDGEDGYSGSRCGLGGGVAVEDAAFRWTAPRAGLFRFTTEGSGFDTILSVRRGSCAGREITCNDNAFDGVSHSSVALELDECETVTLVIDGYDADGIGPYVLAVDTSEGVCTDGLDDDADGLTDCADPDCFGPRCDVLAGEWPDEWERFEQGIYPAVNAQRERGAVCDGETMPPVGPLARDTLLELAARRHSLDMAENRYFSHDSQDGRTVADRVTDVGYESTFVGENIAFGSATVEAVMAGWMASPGHCRNIMSARWSELGVGYAYPDGADGPYWTQDFGAR